jgi:mono/diheme cytochrome c family protein
MRRLLTRLAIVLVIALGGLAAYFFVHFPAVGAAEDVQITSTPELVARGAYLANHVTVCIDCHSTRDFGRFSGPVIPGTEGQGGQRFDHAMAIPGELYARNITPTALGAWSDGEIIRAFTAGVTRDGRPMFPLMPYPLWGQMATADAQAIVAYLRTLPPLTNTPPASRLDFPLNLIVRLIPSPAHPQPRPDPADHVALGRYNVTIAGCQECHTPREGGRAVVGQEFQGGAEFQFPDGSIVRSANLTPDLETGLGKWTKERFLATFRRYSPTTAPRVAAGELNTVMPWTMFSGMTDEDLSAIWDYLVTLKPVYHRVPAFTPASAGSPQKS